MAELVEQRLYLRLSPLSQSGEGVVLEGVEVRLPRTGHDEGADTMRVTSTEYIFKWPEAHTMNLNAG